MSVYDKIRAGLEQAIAHESGGIRAKTVRMSVEPVRRWKADEVRQIRLNTGMTQRLFADVLGVSEKTVEAWEAGRNTPAGPAGRMLTMIHQDPKLPERMHIITK